MDPLMHLSEGHRSDMLLGLSGLTREERAMVQASINNERDFDKVAFNIHVFTFEKAVRTRKERAKMESNQTTN